MADQFQHFADNPIEIDLAEGAIGFAAEAEQAVDDPLAAVDFAHNDFEVAGKIPQPQVLCQLGSLPEAALQGFGIAGHRGHGIVDFMGHPGGQHPDTGHFFRLQQLQFPSPPFGDVSNEDQGPEALRRFGDGGGDHIEIAVFTAVFGGGKGDLATFPAQGPSDRAAFVILGPVGMKQGPTGLAVHGFLGKHPGGEVVAVLHQSSAVVNDDTVANGIEHRLQLGLFSPQAEIGGFQFLDFLLHLGIKADFRGFDAEQGIEELVIDMGGLDFFHQKARFSSASKSSSSVSRGEVSRQTSLKARWASSGRSCALTPRLRRLLGARPASSRP